MSADIDALATAVAAQLNDAARPWHALFTATVSKTPNYTIQDLAELKVTVLPFGETYDTKQRGIDDVGLILEIAFQKKADKKPATGADTPLLNIGTELVALERDVLQFLRLKANRKPPTYTAAHLTRSELLPLYDSNVLTHERRFVGVLRLTYQEFVETD